jgi:hypothetical protein
VVERIKIFAFLFLNLKFCLFNLHPIFAALKGKGGAVAQSVEQRTENPCVAGSIPAHTTGNLNRNVGVFYLHLLPVLHGRLIAFATLRVG